MENNMSSNRKYLNEAQCDFLKKKRTDINRSAQSVSKELGKSEAWLGKMERGCFDSINTNDLINLLSILFQMSCEEVLHKGFLEKFEHLEFEEYHISWYDNELFLDYKNYSEKFVNEQINNCLKNIQEKVIQNTNTKEKYAVWKSLENMCKNMEYSMELTALVNSLELFNLKHLQDYYYEYENNFYRKMELEYYDLHRLGSKKGEWNMYTLINEPLPRISKNINRMIEQIVKAEKLLRILALDIHNKKASGAYNGLAIQINRYVKKYRLSDLELTEIKFKNGSTLGVEDVIHKNMAVIGELAKEIHRHKHNIDKEINYLRVEIDTMKVDTFENLWIGLDI